MLAELNVTNFALIEKTDLRFGQGFNVLTGETGAGKSILIGAINLILGSRASAEMIRHGADEAEVQALFIPDNVEYINRKLEELGLPGGDELVIRRVLPRNGRNRIYINGSIASLAQLAELGSELVAVSGQHEHQQLLDPDRQLVYLDQFGSLIEERKTMTRVHQEWTEETAALGRLNSKIKETREKAELFEFQVKEIRAAKLRPDEDDELEREITLLRNVEKIFALVKTSWDRLYGESGAVIETLDQVRSDLEKASGMDDRLTPLNAQVEDAYHQLDDVAGVLRDHLETLVFDPQRLEEAQERLGLINKLKRKYGATLAEVLEYGDSAADHLSRLSDMMEQREALKKRVESAYQTMVDQAARLSEKRVKAASKMAEDVANELRTLGMPKLKFDIRFLAVMDPPSNGKAPGPVGVDEIEFLIAPNVGEDLMPLARIASGGELSRSLLGLKSLLAGQEKIQTIIFDEVDTGIGGAVAEVVGRKLKALSGYHQLLCITHLPQIAAFGEHHQRVAKKEWNDRTITVIEKLSHEEKTDEIARMIGGLETSGAAKAAALEMIQRAENG